MKTKAKKLVKLLKENNMKISTAESCTGGMIASNIVSVEGASEVFENGYVTYSNEAKSKMICVNEDIINQFGVVSAETAKEMAQCVSTIAETDISIAVTGYASEVDYDDIYNIGDVFIAIYIKGQIYVIKTCIDDFKYHESSEKMRNEIRKTVTKIAIKATCNLLCELTEISDTRWQNEECKINGTSF